MALNCYICHQDETCFFGNQNGNSVECDTTATACVTSTFFDFPGAIRDCGVLPNDVHDGDCIELEFSRYCYCTSDNCNGV